MNEDIFCGIANTYDKYRPSYPQTLFKYLYSNIGLNEYATVADIGSGTGIFSRDLLPICKQVYAVEPNDDMREIAETNLAHENKFISVHATAEATTLPAHCVDYITVAQAFHWFDRKLFKKECKRILKKQGKVILIWNCRDEESEIVQKIDLISKKYCPSFSGSLCGMRGAKSIDDYNDFFADNYEINLFSNPIIFTKERFLGLHQSASYCPNQKEDNYNYYMDELSDFFDLYCKNEILILPNNTRCYIGHV